MRSAPKAPALKLNGLLLVDKTEGITSYDVIRRLKRAIPDQKIGHTGTLDPFATGLLLTLFGEATKLSDFLSDLEKEYFATVKLGEETDTQDKTGQVTKKVDGPWPDREAFLEALKPFEGTIKQRIPKFSAAKHQGKPFYQLAREGEAVPEREHEVEVHKIEVLDYAPPVARLRVLCGKGFYVRALASDLGERLGVGAHLSELRRTKWGPYKVEAALSADAIRGPAEIFQKGVAMVDVLSFLPAVKLEEDELEILRSGQAVKLFKKSAIVPVKNGEKIRMRVCDIDGNLSVVAEAERSSPADQIPPARPGELLLKPLKVLQAT